MTASDADSHNATSPMPFDHFKGLMRATMAVPKEEIDALEKQENESKPPRKQREVTKKAA